MEAERFTRFTTCIDMLSKQVRQVKAACSVRLGVKGVHTFWLYTLLGEPEGLTAAEISQRCGVDPSLVSREIELLREKQLVAPAESHRRGGRRYNVRYTLTDAGRRTAGEIRDISLRVQGIADRGIPTEELAAFYVTLDKLCRNFEDMETVLKENENEEMSYESTVPTL